MKRRINTRFLMVITACVLGGLIIAFVLKRFVFRQNPQQFIQLAQQAHNDGKFDEAALNYGFAFALSNPKDPELLVKQGDAFKALTAKDPESFNKDVQAWNRALEFDPKNKGALQRLMKAYSDQLEFYPNRAELYGRVQSVATRLSALDPSDRKTKSKIYTSTLLSWLSGVATDRKIINDAMAELTKLMEEDPAEADIPFTLAQAKMQLSVEASRTGQLKERDRLRAEVAQLFDDAIKSQPQNTEMHIKAAMTYATLSRTAGRGTTDQKEFAEKFKAELDKSRTMVKLDDPKFIELQATAGLLLVQMGDTVKAQEMFEQLMKDFPNEPSMRLHYARLLRGTPNGRQKAIDVLTAPLNKAGMSGLRAVVAKDYELQMLAEATSMRMDLAQMEQDDAKKKAMMEQVEKDTTKLFHEVGEVPATLTLKGRLAQLQGKNVEAIQTLERANRLLQQEGRPRDYELLYAMARSYATARQTGQAKALLGEIVGRIEGYIPARMFLAQLLLQDNEVKEAEIHLKYLEKVAPNEPEVIRLLVQGNILADQLDQAKALFVKLPEKTVRDCMLKGQLAMNMGDKDEATRLLEVARTLNPKDTNVVATLAGIYTRMNLKDKAVKVVDDAIAANPDDGGLKLLREQVLNPSPEQLEKFKEQVASTNKDPLEKELGMYNLKREQKKLDEALQHLNNAEKLAPNDPRVLDLRFQNSVLQRKWDEATAYQERLGKLNADKADGLIYKFKMTLARGDKDAAMQQAQQLTKRLPEFSISWTSLGQAHQAVGQYSEAIARYLQAVEKQSSNVEAMKGLVDCYYAMNKPDDAKRYIDMARKTLPANQQFYEMDVKHAMLYGNPQAAVNARLDQWRQNPNDKANWANLAAAYLKTIAKNVETNDAGATADNAQKLKELLAQAVEKWPDDLMFYGFQAEVAATTKNLADGEEALKKAAANEKWKDKPEPLQMLAEFYVRFGKTDEAEKALGEAMKKATPEAAVDMRQRLASIQYQAGRSEAALKTLEQGGAPGAGPVDANTAAKLQRQQLQILVSAGRFDDAEKIVKAALEKDPENADMTALLTSIYAQTNKRGEAMALAEKVLAKDPTNIAALYNRGFVRLQQAKPNYDLAIDDLEKVKQRDPNNVDARYWLALAYREKNNWDSSIREMNAALQIAPTNARLRTKMIELCMGAQPARWANVEAILKETREMATFKNDASWALMEADMWIGRRQPAKAVAAAQEAMAMAPTDKGVQNRYLTTLVQAGEYKKVISESDRLIKSGSDNWWLRLSRGAAMHRSEQKDAALIEFDKALADPEAQKNDAVSQQIAKQMAVDLGAAGALQRVGKQRYEKDATWRMTAGTLYQDQGDLPNAIKMIETVLSPEAKATPPQREEALRQLGVLYMGSKPPQAEKAADTMKQLLAINPDDLGSLNNLACLLVDYVEPSRAQEALPYSQHAYDLMLRTGQWQPLIADTHGWTLVQSGKLEDGIILLRQVVDRNPFLDAHYHLGAAYLKKSAIPEAKKQLNAAQDLIDGAKRNKQTYDAVIGQKVEAALQQLKAQAAAP